MRKIFALAILFLATSAYADVHLWKSSATATSDTTQPLCVGRQRGILHNVVVSSASAASSMTIFNSTFTATNVQNTGTIMTSTLGVYSYDLGFPSGLLYTKSGPAQVDILYDCY